MSNQLPVAFNGHAISTVFKDAPRGDELSQGITAGFAVMSYRGKAWSTKYQGVEKTLMREDGDGARGSIEVVIIKAAAPISKIFYEQGYVEGAVAPPDCWSTNGATPDKAAPKKQSETCAGCPKNAWGSKVTDAGKPAKACADSKRLAIVPMGDMENELLGGPMLLRVPPASLKELKAYGEMMQSYGYQYFAVATRIAFDVQDAYPKFVFNAVRPLTDVEAAKVLELRDDPRVSRILNEAVENVRHEPDVTHGGKSPFENGAGPAAQAPQPATGPTPPPAQAATSTNQAPAQAPAKPKPEPKPEPKPKTKAELLREQLAAAEAEEKAQAMMAPKPEDPEVGPAPSNFDELLDGLLPN
jgi:hypothetical protein